ncbi:MAG: efflux RND transporter permease subunit [Treponema sp.]|nr:efflux RND transporter permease subunit [Treponema sp.]
MSLTEKAVNKPVTTLIIFIILTALGIYCAKTLPVDMYPDMDIPYILVITQYDNAGPEEVEQNITRTLESSLSGITGLKKLQSRSMGGASMIIMEMDFGTNLDATTNDIRDKIDLVRSYLPDEAKSPIIMRADPSMMPVMAIVLQGDRPPQELSQYAEDIVQPRLEQIDGVASASLMGGYERSVNINIPRDRLEAYSLTISQIAQMLAAQNIQTSGGTITAGEKNFSIKTAGKYENLEDIRNTVISYSSTTNGLDTPQVNTILLRDIADVYYGYKDQTTLAFIDGKASVALAIQKQSGKNSVTAAHNIRKQFKNIESALPSDVKLVEIYNTTDTIESSINEVINSVVIGALLAILVLFIFLREPRSTLIVGMSIPVSVFITFVLMYLRGMTLNTISLSGLLLGSGMLVDSSIVVLENIFSYRERNTKAKAAAVLGSQEMITSVVASILTTICIFLPMIMFNKKLGIMGQLFNDLAFTIVFSLLASLTVAIVMVPVLSATALKNVDFAHRSGKIYNAVGKIFHAMDTGYAKLVRKVIHHKALVIIVLFIMLIGAFATVPLMGFIFMPDAATDNVSLSITMPQGTTKEVTLETVQQLESIARQTVNGIKYSMVSVGGNSFISSSSDSNTGTLRLTLYPTKERKPGMDNDKTAKEKLRPYFNHFPGADISFSTGMNSMGSSGISVDIRSNDLALVRRISKQVENLLKTQASDILSEVTCDLKDGLPQVEITLDRNRMYDLGVNVASLGSEISGSINGTTASRYSDAGKDIDVIVRLAESDRKKVTDLDQIYVKSSLGKRIALSNFAHTIQGTAPVTIYRENQSRIAHVSFKQLPGYSVNEVQSRVKQLINANIPMEGDLNITYSGDYADMIEAVQNFSLIILMAIVLVFAVMASQFESLKSPFIIMFTIPLALIGVAIIYVITGTKYNVVTIMGLLTLVGTIVNNGIVLVDMSNLYRKRGLPLEEAVVAAAGSRLRPILMSTLTTVISLVPLAFFPGEGTEGLQPIGLTVFGGLSFGTIMTLFLMPTIYIIFNRRNERRRLARQKLIDEQNAKLLAK